MKKKHLWLRLWLSLLGLALLLSLSPVSLVRGLTPVFINEIHYDNTGADVGEAVEIAGPAGTDLSGWKLVPYNGSNGLQYSVTPLSGLIPDLGGGFGVVAYPISGLQNGSPDGIALVDAANNVIQFLSYEGSFQANDGPASGMTSVDIGVSEASSSAVGNSLQLTGTGAGYDDFSWAGSGPNTFGSFNTGQTFSGGGDTPPTVSGTTPPNGAGNIAIDANIDINFSEDVTVSGTWFDITCATSGAHTATVSGGPQNFTLNPNADFVENESCTVTIFAAQVADQDGAPDNMAADYLFSFTTFVPVIPGIIINEINADPDTTDGDANGDAAAHYSDDEFVEIANNTGSDLDISGWTLSDGVSVRHTFPGGTVIPNQCAIVVFGGGSPTGTFGNSLVQTASSGALGLNNSGDTVTLNDGSVDQVSYSYGSEGGDNQSLTRDPDISGPDPLVKHAAATGSGGALFSPGTMIGGAPFAGCPIAVTYIHDVQGAGSASPLVGNTVAIEGIVVGDFQDGLAGTNGDLNGFHVQEEDADADADPLTSEGIFIYNGSSPAVDVQIGDLVRVEGVVSEYNGLTEITSFSGVSVISSGNPLPTVSALSLPVTSVDDFEAFEGMYVTFPQALVISEYFNFDRFNEIVLTSVRHNTPTAEFEPGPAAIAAAQDFLLDKITLDDGRTTQNPDPAIHPNGGVFDLSNRFRGGDTVANVTGVMDYSFGLYRIQPTQGADYTSVNPRTASPDAVGGTIKVASFNVLNYFSTLDDSGSICGPLQNQGCRGADNAEEFTRQRDKIITAISTIDADIVGLLEIENNINDDAVIDLVNGLNDANGPGAYDFVSTGVIGDDAIKVALIYKPASVSPVGSYAILDSSVDSRFIDAKNRPTLAQTFSDNAGGMFTVAVNHFKSKGSACDDVGDPDTGDGAGNCNLTRKAAAEALVDWLASDPTASGDNDFLIIGDLNSYDKEDPIDVIVGAGYTDLAYAFQGEYAYSYVFDGQIGYLDYALASPNLLPQVTGATEWHINADEPDLIDYDTSFKGPNQDAIYAPDSYRASDHDPVVVGLKLDGPPPTITVVKTALPADGTDFAFEGSGNIGTFVLSDTNPAGGNHGPNSITLHELVSGTYTITEILPDSKWMLMSVVCASPAWNEALEVSLPNPPEISLSVNWGQDVTCTFTNNRSNAVALNSFGAEVVDGQIAISWVTETELDTVGFNVMRGFSANGPFSPLNDSLILAQGSPVSGASYSYVDTAPVSGPAYYYLQELTANGETVDHFEVMRTVSGATYKVYLPFVIK